MTTTLQGLSEQEAQRRRAAGQGNTAAAQTSRTVREILRQNIFTLINVILFTLGVMLIVLGYVGDAVISVSLIFFNSVIGIVQEVRAKRQLDQIALLNRPRVTVLREGAERVVDPSEIVLGDILAAHPGDQIVADGTLREGKLDCDESLLTGESDHISKGPGDQVLSGSFVVSGAGYYEAEKVGADSFANKLTSSARAYRVPRTPLQRDIDLVFRFLLGLALFIGLLMLINGLLLAIPLARGVRMATVIAGIVPNGLFAMVIVAYALGALRIVQRGALIQQQNSVESLSNVTVLCMDKTGTLTANRIQYEEMLALGPDDDGLRRALGAFAHSGSFSNRTAEALAQAFPGSAIPADDEAPFSSARKWSGLAFSQDGLHGAYVLGALEMLAPALPDLSHAEAQIAGWTARGLRVLLFAHAPDSDSLHDSQAQVRLPERLQPLALLAFSDELRQDAAETIAEFAQSGVRLKVISGDNPQTVAALARRVGLPGELRTVSGIELAQMDDAALDAIVEETTIFGRITPDQKERLVDALRRRGHYVAMMGDGVNDVLSLKKANLGIAMQSGSAATRGVADMVLLNDTFAALPPAFLEGQRIISGMRDILSLFLTRALYTALIILATAVIGVGFPFVPKHTTLFTFLGVGIPVFFLALWARPQVNRARLLQSVLRFTITGALTAALFGLLVYVGFFASAAIEANGQTPTAEEMEAFRDQLNLEAPLTTTDEYLFAYATSVARTALAIFSVTVGLLLVVFAEPPFRFFVGGDALSPDKRPLVLSAVIFAVFLVLILWEPTRTFFELIRLSPAGYGAVFGICALWMFVARAAWRRHWIERFLGVRFS